MIRLVFLLRRKEGMSLEDFQSYWRNEHAPLVASHARHMNVLRYVQVHALDDPMNDAMAEARGGMEPRYDGVAELWWDSEESLGAALATADGERAAAELLEDEQQFIDLPSSPLYFNYEYPQVNPTPEDIVATPRSTVVKLYFPLRQPEGRDLASAQLYWRTSHGPLIRSQAQALSMLRYMQVHRFETPLEAAIREPRGTIVEPYMGHAEVWFDRGLRRQGPESAAAGQRAIDDEAKFIDFARSAIWIGKEHPIIQYAG